MKSFSRSFLAATTTITNESENPNQVNQAMRHIMNQTMKLQHSRYVLDLYKELFKKNIGTNAIEKLSKKICYRLPEHRVVAIKKMVMKWNIEDAQKSVRRARYKVSTSRRHKAEIYMEKGTNCSQCVEGCPRK